MLWCGVVAPRTRAVGGWFLASGLVSLHLVLEWLHAPELVSRVPNAFQPSPWAHWFFLLGRGPGGVAASALASVGASAAVAGCGFLCLCGRDPRGRAAGEGAVVRTPPQRARVAVFGGAVAWKVPDALFRLARGRS